MADVEFVVEGRSSFPQLWEAKEFKPGDGKPRWSQTILIEPGSPSDKLVREKIIEAAKLEWPKDWEKKLKACEGQSNKYCYIDGDTKSYDGYEGMWALSAHRSGRTKKGPNTPPLIIDRDKTPLTEKDRRPYAGCYIRAKVSIYCQSGENPGVRCSFSVVQYVKKGDAFSTSTPKADDLDDLGVEDEDSMDEMV